MLLQKKLAVQPFQAFTGWKACVTAAHRPRSTVHSAICRPRPAFVDGHPHRPFRGPRSATRRLAAWKARPTTAYRPRPAFVDSFPIR